MQVVNESEANKETALRVYGRQIELLYNNQTFAILITLSIGLVSFFYLSASFSWDELKPLSALFVVVMTIRSFFSWLYFKDRRKSKINLKRAQVYYLIGIVLTGVLWCAATLTLFPKLNLEGQILLLVIITGFATSAQATMGYLKLPVFSFMLLLFVPLIYVMQGSNFPGANDIAIAMFLYFLFMLRSSQIFYKNTHDMLSFREISVDRETELLLQKEKSNAANLAKSEFLSRMSHELRTPLNAILGFSELQLRDKEAQLSNKQSVRLQKIGDAGKHLLSIVNDVLDFSRIETGSMEINLEVINLFKAITTSIRLVEDKASRRNIDIVVEQSQFDVSVMADENRLKQIIVNLLDNAIKFNKLGGMVSLYVKTIENNCVRLYVVDTGFGLQGGDVTELFLPFSRLGAEELGIDGTGIGLSLCKELMELMGGTIGIDNHTTEGCSFWIELPRVIMSEHITADTNIDNSPLNTVKAVKILLVEDNLVNSEVAIDMLATIGINVDVAQNGQKALELFEKNHYELILMDCEMPVMDGFTTTKQLRIKEAEWQKNRIPIIALTAHAISGAREKCIACGMDDFLSKPFSMAALHSIVYKWLDRDTLVLSQHLQNTSSMSSVVSNTVDRHEGGMKDKFICDSNILDCDVLAKLFKKQTNGSANLLSKIVGIYMGQSSKLLADLSVACEEYDIETVRKISHTLKSSSVNVGALKLSTLCRDIELACEKGIIQESNIQSLYLTYANVEKALADILRNNTSPSD